MSNIQDTFTRPNTLSSSVVGNADGWGVASDSTPWFSIGEAGTFQIISNQGQAIGGTGNGTFILSSNEIYSDVDVVVRISSNVSSTANWQGIALRVQDAAHGYVGYFRGSHISITRFGATNVQIADTTFTQTANTEYFLRFRIIGSTLQLKGWADGTAEPAAWTLTVTDAYYTQGRVGLFSNPNAITTTGLFDFFVASDFANRGTHWHRSKSVMRALTGQIVAPIANIPTWTSRAFGGVFDRATPNVNIPHQMRRGLSALLSNYSLHAIGRLSLRLGTTWQALGRIYVSAAGVSIRNGIGRLRSSITNAKSGIGRVRSAIKVSKNILGRILASIISSKNGIGRIRSSITSKKNAAGRLKNSKQQIAGGGGRIKVMPTTYYVATTGSDTTGDGSSGNPWATPWYGVAHIASGNTLIVNDGTYTITTVSNQIDIEVGGTSDVTRVVVKSANKWGAKIINQITPNNTSGNDPAIYVGKNYVDVIGFDVSGSTASMGIVAYGQFGVASGTPAGSHIRIQDCYVHDLGLSGTVVTNSWNVYGIFASPQYTALGYKALYNEVTGCKLNNIGYTDATGSHPIYMPTGYGTCQNNIVSNCPGFGINFYHFPHHMTVSNNLVFKCGDSTVGQGGGIFFSSAAAGTADEVCDFCVCNNNIIRDCSGYAGIYEYNTPSGSVANNTFSNNSYYGNSGCTLGDFHSDVSSANTNPITSDPKFINYLTSGLGDYHLLRKSPCIDAGTITSAPTTDFDTAARPFNVTDDIGPYEFIGSGITGRMSISIGNNAVRSAIGRLRSSIQTVKKTAGRFKLSIQSGKNATGRIRLVIAKRWSGRILVSVKISKSGIGRLLSAIKTNKNGIGRFRSSIQPLKNAIGRTRISAQHVLSAMGRNRLSALSIRNTIGRLRLSAITIKNGTGRIRIAIAKRWSGRILLSIKTLKSGVGRIRASIQTTKNGVGRFRSNVKPTLSALGRLRSSVTTTKSGTGRFKSGATHTFTGTGRFKSSVKTIRSGIGRFRLAISKNFTGRYRSSAKTISSAIGRIKVSTGTLTIKSGIGRFKTSILTSKNDKGRLLLAVLTTRSSVGRFKSSAKITKQCVGRFLSSISTSKSGIGRFRASATALKSTTGRTRISVAMTRNAIGRARIAIVHKSGAVGRLPLKATVIRSSIGRIRITFGTIIVRTMLGRVRVSASDVHSVAGRINIVIATIDTVYYIADNMSTTQIAPASTTFGIAYNSTVWDV